MIYILFGLGSSVALLRLESLRAHPLGAAELYATLPEARKALPPGLSLAERYPSDDPNILECWTLSHRPAARRGRVTDPMRYS